ASTPCGEYADLDQCNCGGTVQNSHRWLQTILGDSQEALVGPVLNIQSPAQDQAVTDGFPVSVTATHVRGIGTVELFLNGTSYSIQDAHPREMAGFPYEFIVPSDLSDGIIDVEVRATNDIGTETIAMVTVQKGEPCTGQASCQNSQSCEDGRCVIPPAIGMLGDSCTTGEDCISGICPLDGEQGICSVTCFLTTTEETCSAGFTCTQASPGNSICWPKSESGSCGCQHSTSGGVTSIILCMMVLWRFRRRTRYINLR
ncbi:MAG: hypothetical protein JKY56_13525, partial [Kofleriaceae bacterium]|nr:hypothetical protein [Kofleriaceae bacterium]